MSRESDWAVFEKACEITASAVRGTMNGQDGQQAGFVGEVFREIHSALKQAAEEMPDKNAKAGFYGPGREIAHRDHAHDLGALHDWHVPETEREHRRQPLVHVGVGSDRRGVRGHERAHLMVLRVELRGHRAEHVALREDPHQSIGLHHQRGSHFCGCSWWWPPRPPWWRASR